MLCVLLMGVAWFFFWRRCDTLYILPVLWMADNGPHGGMSIPLQRVTSLHGHSQANAPAALYWLAALCPRRRQAPRLEESVVKRVPGGATCNALCLVKYVSTLVEQ